MQGSESQVVRAGQANLPGNKQKIQMTHNPSGRTLREINLAHLRRSFGVVAANRGVKRSGLYAAVRHPMYLGYLVTYIGAFAVNPSSWNAVLLSVWLVFEVLRIFAEERILMQDEAYREHAAKVKFRLIPGVW